MTAPHCPRCRTPLERVWTRRGDPALWCEPCARGWLPGTKGFDALLERQNEPLDARIPLWDPLELPLG